MYGITKSTNCRDTSNKTLEFLFRSQHSEEIYKMFAHHNNSPHPYVFIYSASFVRASRTAATSLPMYDDQSLFIFRFGSDEPFY